MPFEVLCQRWPIHCLNILVVTSEVFYAQLKHTADVLLYPAASLPYYVLACVDRSSHGMRIMFLRILHCVSASRLSRNRTQKGIIFLDSSELTASKGEKVLPKPLWSDHSYTRLWLWLFVILSRARSFVRSFDIDRSISIVLAHSICRCEDRCFDPIECLSDSTLFRSEGGSSSSQDIKAFISADAPHLDTDDRPESALPLAKGCKKSYSPRDRRHSCDSWHPSSVAADEKAIVHVSSPKEGNSPSGTSTGFDICHFVLRTDEKIF
jgi:hypothetical protein